jgi:hypothetical protein
MTIKQRFFIIAIVCILAMLLPAFACDLHDSGGYGFSPFGPRFSMLDRNEMDRNQHTTAKLSITHDRFYLCLMVRLRYWQSHSKYPIHLLTSNFGLVAIKISFYYKVQKLY